MNQSLLVRTFFTAAAVLLSWGCTSSSNSGAPSLNPLTGQHPSDWITNHWSAYLQDGAQCETCHGSASVQPTTPPVSGVTCFGCHHPNGPNHDAATWTAPGSVTPAHGLAAMAAAAPAFNPAAPVFANQGFASCTPCHGALYNDASGGLAVSCYSCHTTAPHPPTPWGAGLGLPDTQPRHDLVDPSNAPECAKCHANGQNSTITPTPPAPAGTAPGCFNGTLCHTSSF
jgi:hypothetical protein